MTNRKGGFRRGTRYKFMKPIRAKGKISQRSFFQKLETGDKVLLAAESGYQRGMYYPRYHGMIGVVESKSGICYNVTIKDHNREKTLIIHPVHLRKL